MIYDYSGHHGYDKWSVTSKAPDNIGVYYCGVLNFKGLIPLYIGRAIGENVTIKSRLLDHVRDDNWPEVTHFGYQICTTVKEAEDLEASEIASWKPKYNKQGK